MTGVAILVLTLAVLFLVWRVCVIEGRLRK